MADSWAAVAHRAAAGGVRPSRREIVLAEIDNLESAQEARDLAFAGSVFLKVDTQGSEKEVLAGAISSLPTITGLLLELPIAHLYENVWSFQEAIAHIDRIGFTPAQFRMVNPDPKDTVSGVEFDCVFRRKT